MKSSVPHVHPDARERVIELTGRGKEIPAIKLVREVTGAGFKEAKEYVVSLKGEAFARSVPPDVQGKARVMVAEGRWKDAVKMVRRDAGLGSRAAKDYVDAVRDGRLSMTAPGEPSGMLSDRVRAFKHAGDLESVVALVCAETGMGRDEALRFVHALQ